MSSPAQTSTQVKPSRRGSWLRPKYFLFAFAGLMLAYVLRHDEYFLIDAKDPEWPHIQIFRWWLLPHALAGACALLLGPMQFSERLRKRFTGLHHVAGYIYIAGTFIAAPMGVVIQHLNERQGFAPSFTIETAFQGGLWFATTAIALAFILKGNVQLHRQWMTRSYCTGPLIFLAVRVIGGVTHWEDLGPHVNEVIVWSCTVSSIFVADLILQGQELYRSRAFPARNKTANPVRGVELAEAAPGPQE
ncbi:MAG TPA: DUF2306 domain-containing protein [Candidatus Acidoferrales bacterium]|jgi:uncharacterized membrane protein